MLVEKEHIIATIKAFIACNAGDEATEDLLVNLGSEILDISQEKCMSF